MGGACSAYGGEERCILGFGGGNLRKKDHLEDPGVDGRIIFFPMPTHVLVDFVVFPPGHGRSVTDF